jgi:hypothetical protein
MRERREPLSRGPGATSLELRLDHASVEVPDLEVAVSRLDRLGLRATVTPEAPDRHSRVYLDRSYVEVAAGSGPGWRTSLFFLRFDDPSPLREHLESVGIEYRFGEYRGVDGTWDDVEIRAGSVPLPILARRTAPADVARRWPPPLGPPHRCGARELVAVHVAVPSLDEAVEVYGALAGSDPIASNDRSGRRIARLRLASGEIVLEEQRSSDAPLGLVLGVVSIASTRAALERRTRAKTGNVVWLDPRETNGLRLGFVELHRGAP